MRITALVKKELKHFFLSPLAYVVMAIFLIISGWFFVNTLFLSKEAELRGLLDIMPLLLMFFIPALTMRSIAEERKIGTVQLLLTLPVKEWEVIFSKYIASVVFFVVMLLFTLFYPVLLYLLGRPDTGMIITDYIGLFMLGATYISIGIFASALTSSQVIGFIIGFALIFCFFVLGRLEPIMPVKIQPLIESVSIITHFENLLRGVINSSDLVYYLTVNLFFLTIATYVLEERRK